MRGSHTAELVFQDCEVPAENVLGRLDRGVNVLMSGLAFGRTVLSAERRRYYMHLVANTSSWSSRRHPKCECREC
jgi:alkylation response protein AidB-like acyl-CoA dehydrogenase